MRATPRQPGTSTPHTAKPPSNAGKRSLIDRLLARLVTQGVLEVVHADGRVATIGEPAPGFPSVRVRFTDAKVGRDIMLDPRLGAAEAFMDGRLVIERGDVMDLVGLIRANNRWDHGRNLAPPSVLRRLRNRITGRPNT